MRRIHFIKNTIFGKKNKSYLHSLSWLLYRVQVIHLTTFSFPRRIIPTPSFAFSTIWNSRNHIGSMHHVGPALSRCQVTDLHWAIVRDVVAPVLNRLSADLGKCGITIAAPMNTKAFIS